MVLQFSQIATENNYDFVEIFTCEDGIACLQVELVARVSGAIIPEPLSSDTGIFKLLFTSDSAESSSQFGFNARYEAIGARASNCPDRKTMTVGSGNDVGVVDFWTTHAGEKYLNNAYCSWILDLTVPGALELSFPLFDTEANWDVVRISECADVECRIYNQLENVQFSGPEAPALFWTQFTSSTVCCPLARPYLSHK